MEGKKPRPCYIWRGKVYDYPLTYRDATPAVAITRTAYDEARSTMLETASYHTKDADVPYCRVCGASDGHWPCSARINAESVLILLPEIPE